MAYLGQFLTVLVRVSITVLPIALVFLVIENHSNELSAQICFVFSLIQLTSILSRGGSDIFINQRFRNNKLTLALVGKLTQVITLSALANMFFMSIIWLAFDGVYIESIGYIKLYLCSFLFTTLWLILSFYQAAGYSKIGLSLTLGLFYASLIVAICTFAKVETLNAFVEVFLACLAFCVIVSLLLYILVTRKKKHSEESTDRFRYTPLLWLNSVSGTGVFWFIQTFSGVLLDSESYLIFMTLLRYGQIPMAATTGTGFLANRIFSYHEDNNLKFFKRYLKICGLNGFLGFSSIILIPFLTYFLPNVFELYSAQNVYIVWALGIVATFFGPIAIILAIVDHSKPAIVIRLIGLSVFIMGALVLQEAQLGSVLAFYTVALFLTIQILERMYLFFFLRNKYMLR